MSNENIRLVVLDLLTSQAPMLEAMLVLVPLHRTDVTDVTDPGDEIDDALVLRIHD